MAGMPRRAVLILVVTGQSLAVSNVACSRTVPASGDPPTAATSCSIGEPGLAPQGGGSAQGEIASSTVSGYVLDGRTGKPLQGASVSTIPATTSAQTNAEGLFVLQVGAAIGRLSIVAEAPKYRQALPTCITLKAGLNTLADTLLARADGSSAGCVAACADSETCLGGVCASRCFPLCACGQRCSAAGVCEPDPNAPAEVTCGAGSVNIGAGACICDAGYVASGDGTSCVPASAASQCPTGATPTATGCECMGGLVPTASGQRCTQPDQAVEVHPFTKATVVRHLTVPFAGPRGLAFDGAAFWMGDAVTGELKQVGYDAGPDHPVVLKTWPAQWDIMRQADLGWGNGALYVVVAAGPKSTAQLLRVEPSTGLSTDLTSMDLNAPFAVAETGARLLVAEGSSLVPRDYVTGQSDIARAMQSFVDASGSVSVVAPGHVVEPPLTQWHGINFKYAAFSSNQVMLWAGTILHGDELAAEIVLLSTANRTLAVQLGRLQVVTGASHVVGLEAWGNTLWVLAGGAGTPTPMIVEAHLE